MRPESAHHAVARIERAVARLSAALQAGDPPPALAELAAEASWSPFHFHRLFRALTGEPVGALATRLRLRRALDLLECPDHPVTEVALAVGYASPQALARVVRQQLGTTPAALRRDAALRAQAAERLAPPAVTRGTVPVAVEVVSLAPFRAAAIRATGDPEALAAVYGRLFDWAAEAGVLDAVTGIWGIDHDDRRDTPPDAAASTCLLAVDGAWMPAADMHGFVFDGGRCARLRHTGPYDGLDAAADALYRWLADSGLEPAATPLLMHYLDDPEQTPAERLRTDLVLPLAG